MQIQLQSLSIMFYLMCNKDKSAHRLVTQRAAAECVCLCVCVSTENGSPHIHNKLSLLQNHISHLATKLISISRSTVKVTVAPAKRAPADEWRGTTREATECLWSWRLLHSKNKIPRAKRTHFWRKSVWECSIRESYLCRPQEARLEKYPLTGPSQLTSNAIVKRRSDRLIAVRSLRCCPCVSCLFQQLFILIYMYWSKLVVGNFQQQQQRQWWQATAGD